MIRPEIDFVAPRGGRPTLIALIDAQENRLKRRHYPVSGSRVGNWVGSPTAPSPYTRIPKPKTKSAFGSGAKGRTSARALDQFYTRDVVVANCLEQLGLLYNLASWMLVEPSAGGGAFRRPMPRNSIAFDIDPKGSGIIKVDFLSIELRCAHRMMIVGNPPFGRNACLAIRFFNHAARQSDVIAMIFPRSFLKASIENQLNEGFHLVCCNEIPPNAFELDGKRRDVGAVFQIWERRAVPRDLRPEELTHPDFEFTTPALADFWIRRVGVNAGWISHDRNVHEDSYYFIKGDVEHIMAQLDLAGAARNATSTPSLAKSEIVALYRERVEGRSSLKGCVPAIKSRPAVAGRTQAGAHRGSALTSPAKSSRSRKG